MTGLYVFLSIVLSISAPVSVGGLIMWIIGKLADKTVEECN